MAIDFQQTFETIHDLQDKVDELVRLAKFARDSIISTDYFGDTPLTTEQKQALLQKYQELKSELTALYNQLP